MDTIKSATTFFIVQKYVSLTLYITIGEKTLLFLPNFNYKMLQENVFVFVFSLQTLMTASKQPNILAIKHSPSSLS